MQNKFNLKPRVLGDKKIKVEYIIAKFQIIQIRLMFKRIQSFFFKSSCINLKKQFLYLKLKCKKIPYMYIHL